MKFRRNTCHPTRSPRAFTSGAHASRHAAHRAFTPARPTLTPAAPHAHAGRERACHTLTPHAHTFTPHAHMFTPHAHATRSRPHAHATRSRHTLTPHVHARRSRRSPTPSRAGVGGFRNTLANVTAMSPRSETARTCEVQPSCTPQSQRKEDQQGWLQPSFRARALKAAAQSRDP